jgi:hypothetical protein
VKSGHYEVYDSHVAGVFLSSAATMLCTCSPFG